MKTIMISRNGISLSQLCKFRDENLDDLQGKTTGEVVQIIKLRTESRRCCYVELLRLQGEKVSEATRFTSHAWSGNFLDLVAALEKKYASTQSSECFWIDVFVVPQNESDKPAGDGVWYDAFERMLRETGKVVVVLTPFDAPVYLTRSWCLFEFLVAIKLELEFDIVLSPVEEVSLIEFLESGGDFKNLFSGIDFGNAKASVETDRKRIRERVVNDLGSDGFVQLNSRVMEKLRMWLAGVAKERHDVMSENERSGSAFQIGFGRMLFEMGRFREAEEVLKECTAVNKANLCDLARVFTRLGRSSEALDALKVDLMDCIQSSGPWNFRVIKCFTCIGIEYMENLGLQNEALAMFRKCEEVSSHLGIFNVDRLAFLNYNMGLSLFKDGKYEESLKHLELAKKGHMRFDGPGNIYTLETIIWIGGAERELGRPADACQKHTEVLMSLRATAGNEFHSTGQALMELARDHAALDQCDLALEEAKEARKIFEIAQGPSHANTAEAASLILELSSGQKKVLALLWLYCRTCLHDIADFSSDVLAHLVTRYTYPESCR